MSRSEREIMDLKQQANTKTKIIRYLVKQLGGRVEVDNIAVDNMLGEVKITGSLLKKNVTILTYVNLEKPTITIEMMERLQNLEEAHKPSTEELLEIFDAKDEKETIDYTLRPVANEGLRINEITKEIHQNAVDHGWWEDERTFGEIIALCHAELSEALEEYRNGHKPNETYYNCQKDWNCGLYEPDGLNAECEDCKKHKPEGIPTELADTIIRIFDYCGHAGIDIEEAIRIKHEYNKTRPWKHNGKVI